MEKLIRYLNKRIPAFWGLLLLLPLMENYLPDLYSFLHENNINAVVAFVAWLVIYEIFIFHVVSPLLILLLVGVIAFFGSHVVFFKISPGFYKKYLDRFMPKDSGEKDNRKKIAIELVRNRFKTKTTLSENEALKIAIHIGEVSVYYEEAKDDRDSEVFYFLSLTSLAGAVSYYYLAPDLSLIGITFSTAVWALSLSVVFLFTIAHCVRVQDQKRKLNAALIYLTENIDNEEPK